MIQKIPINPLKRIFDIIVSGFLIIILSPFILLSLVLILIEHIVRGTPFASLFYVETRISQGEKFPLIKFNIFNPRLLKKLRSEGKFIHTKALEKDARGTILFGKFLKQIYLDELPQLFNVFVGHISLVGPRPVNLQIYEKRVAKGLTCKTVLRAGITGSYQSYKGNTDKTDVELDTQYINFCKNNSGLKIVLNDIKIILRTLVTVLKAKGL